MTSRTALRFLAALSLSLAAPLAAHAADSCFRVSQMQGTHADGDRRIYVRVGVNTFFRLDLAHRCASLPYADRGLVLTPAGGNDLICSPIQLDLKVNDNGALEPCTIQSITRLTPEEAAAIPKKVKP